MTKRSYFTTPLFVLVCVISLGVYSYAFATTQIINDTSLSSLNATYGQHAKVVKYLAIYQKETSNHIETPETVQAIYISSWVAGTNSLRNGLIDLLELFHPVFLF